MNLKQSFTATASTFLLSTTGVNAQEVQDLESLQTILEQRVLTVFCRGSINWWDTPNLQHSTLCNCNILKLRNVQ